MIFENVDGQPRPRLAHDHAGRRRVVDGTRFFSLPQAAKRFRVPVELLKRDWVSYWGDVPAPPYRMIFEVNVEPAPPALRGEVLVPDGRRFLSVDQAADLTGLSREWLRERWLNLWRHALPEAMIDTALAAEGLPPQGPRVPTIKDRRRAAADEIGEAMSATRPRGKGAR